MRKCLLTALIVAGVAYHAGAQGRQPVKADSLADRDAFLRTRGDTLWFTEIEEGLPGRPLSATTDSVLFKEGRVFALVLGRQVQLPPSLAPMYRLFLRLARECPRPTVGCELDEGLFPDALARRPDARSSNPGRP
jgi:hypothetical protein